MQKRQWVEQLPRVANLCFRSGLDNNILFYVPPQPLRRVWVVFWFFFGKVENRVRVCVYISGRFFKLDSLPRYSCYKWGRFLSTQRGVDLLCYLANLCLPSSTHPLFHWLGFSLQKVLYATF